MKRQTLKVLDLFCGPGGFSTGFEAAGFEVVAAFDKDKWAVKTFTANHSISAETADLASFDMAEMPAVDVIIGGPPCTQFSSAKSNKTRNVLDGLLLVQSFLRCVYFKKPRYWIMENVPTIQKYLPPSIPLRWIGIDNDGELEIPQKAELIAADYGVPQRRKRYLIGNFPLPDKTHRSPADNGLFDDPTLPTWRVMRDALSGLPSPHSSPNETEYTDPNYGFSISMAEVTDHFYDPSLTQSEARSIRRAKTEHPYMGVLAWPDNLDEPARTVVATQLGRETLVIEDPAGLDCRYRRASVRECASMQSFPSSYQFFGSSYGVKYRLVGDAVPPLMSYAIAKKIITVEGKEVLAPKVRETISEKANFLGGQIKAKRKKVSTKRTVSIMLPSKEVRGARSEFFTDGYNETTGEYKDLKFELPIWKCRLVLGEGAGSTITYMLDQKLAQKFEEALLNDQRFASRTRRLMKRIDKVVQALPKNSEFYGRHCFDIEERSVYGTADEIAKQVELDFPKEAFHNKYIDVSDAFDHPKAKRLRVRLALGALIGTSIALQLNQSC